MLAACLVLAACFVPPSAAGGQDPVAHAVLFFSPECPHCRELIRNELPPILDEYGDKLQILAVDAVDPDGAALFKAAVTKLDVPAQKRGVPAVVIGDHFLAGTSDVSEQLPMLAAQYLAAGGVGWPDVPGLSRATSAGAVVTSSPARLLAVTEPPDGILDRLARDRWGNTIALILLAGMLAAVGLVVARATAAGAGRARWSEAAAGAVRPRGWRLYAGVALIAAGLGIAGYLSYVVATDAAVLCGPLGACDAVQQSDYARLFGALPVAYLGLAAYLLVALAYAATLTSGHLARTGALTFLALTLLGTLFSIYLTILEPFVIGAACIWCMGSAAVMTLLLLLAADGLGLRARHELDQVTKAVSSSA